MPVVMTSWTTHSYTITEASSTEYELVPDYIYEPTTEQVTATVTDVASVKDTVVESTTTSTSETVTLTIATCTEDGEEPPDAVVTMTPHLLRPTSSR